MMQSPHQDKTPAGNRLVYKNIELDPAAGQVLRAGRPVALSPKERCLLAFLLTHRGQAFTREELLACVWDVTTPSAPARWICTSASCGANWAPSWTL